ncbi:hypothetical protein KEM48_007320 [Puccinia striiformis f. sp. tritici PST-130]|nr:hypothetical protein KEM48_007068 [Puccinia striiformis f. sp. tritici PST-130]KAI9622337.1 hypothetical protein KEM48_007320 [Puccinia striiformis f. sp. tritici PST-130]
MRKVLRAAGAVGQSKQSKLSPQQPCSEAGKLTGPRTTSGTALLTNKIEDNTDPRKLSERISTNQKVTTHQEQSGNVNPAQPEQKEPDGPITCS